MWHQQTLTLSQKSRGFHLITDEVLGQITALKSVKTGLLHLLLQHTSASLTLNENCDPTVRQDMGSSPSRWCKFSSSFPVR
ncbi:hypothetical protein CYD30_17065 [Kosakonia cowanii]|nr:hypothetical protein CYD30_17065 [Kosakonia cowanii]